MTPDEPPPVTPDPAALPFGGRTVADYCEPLRGFYRVEADEPIYWTGTWVDE